MWKVCAGVKRGHYIRKTQLYRATGKSCVYLFCAVQAKSITITLSWPRLLSAGPSGVCSPSFLTTYEQTRWNIVTKQAAIIKGIYSAHRGESGGCFALLSACALINGWIRFYLPLFTSPHSLTPSPPLPSYLPRIPRVLLHLYNEDLHPIWFPAPSSAARFLNKSMLLIFPTLTVRGIF